MRPFWMDGAIGNGDTLVTVVKFRQKMAKFGQEKQKYAETAEILIS